MPLAAQGNSDSSARIQLRGDEPGATVDPEVYGHFAEHLGRSIYEGIWVGEDSEIPNTRGIRNDVVEALRELNIPVLRWPGGCFADEYHWRDGIGPRAERPMRINSWWGQVPETNAFGTHEFFDLVEMLDTKAYVAANVGSGSPREMMEWVEYMTSDSDSELAELRRQNGREEPWRVDYIGIGNENWGCGGNMRPEYYADLYRRFATFVKNYGEKIYRVAGGANGHDVNWTDVLMDRAANHMDGLSVHYYTLPTGDWGDKGPATGFDEEAYHNTLANGYFVDTVIGDHAAAMDHYDPEKRVGMLVDEWGIWTNVEPDTNPAFLYQQNTIRDAIVAAMHFHIFHDYADRIHMANIAQTVNVLQAMILTDGPRMLRTPTYWVFEMYKVHQGGTYLPVEVESGEYTVGERSVPRVTATATKDPESGAVHFSLLNTHPEEASSVSVSLEGLDVSSASGRILTGNAIDAHNSFEDPDRVSPVSYEDFSLSNGTLELTLPSKSIVVLTLE